MSRHCCVLLLTFALSAIGCSSGPTAPPTVPVSGRVTLDKAPLAGASVEFQPLDKGAVTFDGAATTDDQGNYELKLSGANFGDVKGVPPGKYRINIGKVERGEGLKQLVPEKYNRLSKLTFDVPAGGTKEANFDLTK